MSKLLMLKGLPASGKSTYAKELVKHGWKRVNKDELRVMIDNSEWSRENEEFIKESEFMIAKRFLSKGLNVVVDDTNFAYESNWEQIAKLYKSDFEVKYFDTPPDECVMRDSKRGDKSVGADVIWKMYRKYVEPNIKKPIFDAELPSCYIFDIDGTLALMKDRSPFDWKRVGEDRVNSDVRDTLLKLKQSAQIIILSGRDSVCRPETEQWLTDNLIPFNGLLMRAEGDSRKDSIIKRELYENHIAGKYNVLGVFDDRNQVVALWRSLGLTCYQVAEGNF